MSNLTKLKFVILDISGKNYLSWILDTEIHLDAMNLGATIKEGNQASLQDCAKALIFLRHHLYEGLKKKRAFDEKSLVSSNWFEPFPEVNAILSQTRGCRRG